MHPTFWQTVWVSLVRHRLSTLVTIHPLFITIPHVVGIVSILFCGVVMAHYTYHNLSPEAQKFSSKLFKVVASLSEMFVFAYLGLALFSFDQVYDVGLLSLIHI